VEGGIVGQEGVLLLSAGSLVDPEPTIFIAVTFWFLYPDPGIFRTGSADPYPAIFFSDLQDGN
jgi:hypothetical protein